jgi:uracil-DNA glycosylase family 4
MPTSYIEDLYIDVFANDPEAIPGRGPLKAERIVVGISPSASRPDYQRNEPLGARSLRLLESHGATPLYITNLKKLIHPFGKKVPLKEMKFWGPLLYEELKLLVIPGVTRILTLGTEPAQLLCPAFRSLREDHGAVFSNPELEAEVIPTYHFSAAARDSAKKAIITNDLKRFFTGEFNEAQPFVIGAPQEPLTDETFLDIETSGLELFSDKIIQIGIMPDKESPVYIAPAPSKATHKKIFNLLREKTIIGHNIAFDLAFLEQESGLPWTSLRSKDTMLAAYLLGEQILSLKHLTSQYTSRRGSHSGGSFEDPQYLAEDLASTRAVGQVFLKRAEQQWISNLLYALSPRIAKMRLHGVHIDWHAAGALATEYTRQIGIAEKKLKKMADINWNSTQQVAKALKEAGVPLVERTPTGNYSVAEPVIAKFREDYPIVTAYFEHKDLLHWLSFIQSYMELRGPDLRLHPKFNLMGAATGRSSMSEPNLQQVPRLGPIKTLFTSRFAGGFLGLIDLSQAELRIAALLADDEKLAAALMKEDVHRYIASVVYGIKPQDITPFQRKKSKGVTFGLLYGGGAKGLSERIGVEESEVKKVIKSFYGLFPKLAAYIEEQKDLAITTGQSVTPLGRIRDLSNLIADEGESSAQRKGINTPIQGTASDVNLIIMNHILARVMKLNLQSSPVFGVHDSSVHDIHPDEVRVYSEIVQDAFHSLSRTPLAKLRLWKTLPLTGELLLGPTWASVESTCEGFYNPISRLECSSLA